MPDSSFTGIFDNEIHYPLKKILYDGNYFHLLDLTHGHTVITGNKAWKLKYNLKAFYESGAKKILTFGGAYSNHIYQTAKLGYHLGISTIGLIRGAIDDVDNPMLNDVRKWGMHLIALDRSTYRKRGDEKLQSSYKREFNCYIIPEGGTNQSALRGTEELGNMVHSMCEENEIANIGVAVGTGGTMGGLVNGIVGRKVVGYGALKGDFLKSDVGRWVTNSESSWEIIDDQYFGGYGKWNQDLVEFIHSFHSETGIALDPIYTGKMMYAAHRTNRLTPDWLYIHTGGLQGNRGFNQRFGLTLPTS